VATTIDARHPAELDVRTAYRILQLRVDVFVVEQRCAYAELDGRDLEPHTLWVWSQPAPEEVSTKGPLAPAATLRILTEQGGVRRIGRVATAPAYRGGGQATAIMRHALHLIGGDAVVLDAQSPLQGWYERFGFGVCGARFVEDGIEHIPMRLG
jgi:ElaA protein